MDEKDIKQVIDECVKPLSKAEYSVICTYFGINQEENRNLDQLSKILDKSKIDTLKMIEKSFEKMQTAIPKKILYQLFKEGNPKKYYSQEVDYISILKKELKEYVEKGILSDDSWLKNIFLKNRIELLHIPTLNSDISIGELDLTILTYNCLKRAKINTLRELMEKSDKELKQVRNMGKKSLEELKHIRNHYEDYILPLENSSKDYSFGKYEYVIYRQGEKTHLKFILNVLEKDKISDMLFDELFPVVEGTLLDTYHSPYPSYITTILVILGYINIEDVIKDADILNEYLYTMNLIQDKDYLINQYKKVYSDYFPISQENYNYLLNNPSLALAYVENLLHKFYTDIGKLKDEFEERDGSTFVNVNILENHFSNISDIDKGLDYLDHIESMGVHIYRPLEDYIQQIDKLGLSSPDDIQLQIKLDDFVEDDYLYDRDSLIAYIKKTIDPDYECLSSYEMDDEEFMDDFL